MTYDTEMLEVSLKPEHCTCPNDGFTCVVRQGTELEWIVNTETFVFQMRMELSLISFRQISFLNKIFLLYILSVNESNITCQSAALVMNMPVISSETVEICVIGKYKLPSFVSMNSSYYFI